MGSGAGDAPGGHLVTGATGFVGGAVVRELLQHGDAQVHCLVRASTEAAATERVRVAVGRHGPLRPEWEGRLSVVTGDVMAPRLGMDQAVHARMAETVSTIVHCAALTRGALPVASLRAVNVGGTERVLALAGEGAAKTVVLVSTVAVLSGVDFERRLEATVAADVPPPLDAYARSKWEAEQLVGRLGGGARIARLGAVGGSTTTGWCNPVDMRWLVLRAALGSAACPAVEGSFSWLPVDAAATALRVLTERCPAPPGVVHLVGSPRVSWLEVFSWLRRAGWDLAVMDLPPWRRRVAERCSGAMDAGSIVAAAQLLHAGPSSRGVQHVLTDEFLRSAGVTIPECDRSYVCHLVQAAVRSASLDQSTVPW